MSFDWQTEEESDWDEQQWQETPETAVPPIRPWRTIILILILLSVGGFIIYQQVNERLEEATVAVEADIFATHNLLGRAAAAQDGDLGKAVLSGRDLGWSQAQTDLLAAGLFSQNPTFGLALASPQAAYAPLSRADDRFVSLEIDPALESAELQYGQEYRAFTEDGMETIILLQTAVYRRGETRWLFAPPLEEFWGEWQTEEGEVVNVSFPTRDEEIAMQLTEDLDALVAKACAERLDLNCFTPIRLRLDFNPESLLTVADPANLYDGNLRFNLPTPSLIGLPVNEAGYQAVLNAYAAQLFSGLIAQSVGYECCQQAPMFQALMRFQLSEMGVADWPVTQQTQQELALVGVHTELLFPYWSSTDFALINNEDSWQLYGFIDFLLNQYVPQLSTMDLMREMNESRVYQSWLVGLQEAAGGQLFGEMNRISRDWWFYAMTQAEATAVSQQPIPLPAQDLQIACVTDGEFGDFPESILYRYQLDKDEWVEETTFTGLYFFNPPPHDNGIILQQIDTTSELPDWQTIWWKDGAGISVANPDEVYTISLGQMDPEGQFLLTYFGSIEEEFSPEPLLIDIESCRDGNCETVQLTRNPYWSPDGQGMLLTTNPLFAETQYVVDGRIITLSPEAPDTPSEISFRYVAEALETAVVVGEGVAPFWVNNEQFGYIRTVLGETQTPMQELVIASIADPTAVPLLTTEDLVNVLPKQLATNLLQMRYALAHPTNPDLLVVMAVEQIFEAHLYLVDRQTGDIERLFALDISRGDHTLGFSPDGRFLVATGAIQPETTVSSQQNNFFGGLFLYDFEDSSLQTILVNIDTFLPSFTFDWAMDGNWLAFTRDTNVIGLVAPAYNFQQSIPHENGNCTSLAWINQ
ncbi:TolB family protein [Candidatus Leptofilum sp.]|uniref:TolB family protein n=1 Tax=Candidatus Leptofilum sp. TaxID=3241576 RepID=UPI003B59E7C9